MSVCEEQRSATETERECVDIRKCIIVPLSYWSQALYQPMISSKKKQLPYYLAQ